MKMTNSSLLKTMILATTIAVLMIIGLFFTSLSGGGELVAAQAQSTAATQASQFTPPTPKEQPDVAQ